jgi:Icc protein
MSKRIIQLTDLHLQASSETLYKGVLPDARLNQCLTWLEKQEYDLLLLTGDLCHGGHVSAYQRLKDYLAHVDKPWLWLPGNHDNIDHMLQVSDQPIDSVRALALADWQVILLNSTHKPDGRGGGSISQAHMLELTHCLEANQSKPTLIVLHHNPIPVASTWQDKIMLGNASDFTQLLNEHKQVKGVVFGHIHQPLDRLEGGVRYLGTPATSVQFAVQQEQFTLQPELGPGLRTIDLSEDITWQTQVTYIDQQASHYV